MERLTYEDWVQWGVCCAVAKCEDPTRVRFEKFVARHVAENLRGLPEWLSSRLGDYLEDNAAGRRRCATIFDGYMLRGRKKALVLGCTPKNQNPTEDDYAGAWSAYATTCIRSMVREVVIKEVPRYGKSPVELDKPVEEGKAKTRGDITPAGGATVEDTLSLREVETMALTFVLNERERLILWANQHGCELCSANMRRLAGCGKTQLYASEKQLEQRLCNEIIRLFQLEPHENEQAAEWTDWAWQILAQKFQNIFPEREGDDPLVWVSDDNVAPTISHASTP